MERKSLGQLNAYVEAGKSREERRKRLAEVPEELRDQVKRHVMTVFAIAKFNNRRLKK